MRTDCRKGYCAQQTNTSDTHVFINVLFRRSVSQFLFPTITSWFQSRYRVECCSTCSNHRVRSNARSRAAPRGRHRGGLLESLGLHRIDLVNVLPKRFAVFEALEYEPLPKECFHTRSDIVQ